jgi:glyoxylase-like metal-dependent hydrolase (beta-lactamase superfamily II)
MTKSPFLAAVLSMVAIHAAPAAGGAQERAIVARDADARVERLAPDVYAIIHQDATTDWETGTTEWPHGNTGVIVGTDGVLVVDATYLPARARADIALIRTLTDKPVRYLVNTHWHGDHTHGNGVYRDEFPGITIIGQEANRRWIATNLARYPAVVANGASGKQASIASLEALLGAGQDSTGKKFTDTQKQLIADNIARRKHELEEFRKIQIVPPTLLFGETMTVYLGERRVELRNQGRANSPADVTVYLPAEKVLFTGDIVVHPVPYVGASHPLPWIDVLAGIERMDVAALVPGHGPVMSDMRYVRLVRELFESARDQVAALQEKGVLLDSIVKTVTLDDFRSRFVTPGDPALPGHWYGTPAVLVERMHQCVQGYRC